MKIIKVSLENPEDGVIEEAAKILRSCGLVVYPTDTAYGLGGNGLDERALDKVFRVKGRRGAKPVHVVVRDRAMVESLVYLNEAGRRLIKTFWPGPLTLVFRKKKNVSARLTGGGGTLGVRLPRCAVTRAISSRLNFPYTTPSANPEGLATPYSIETVLSQFSSEAIDQIGLGLDAGTLPRVLPSTIIDLSGGSPNLLREGPLSKREIEAILGIELV